MDGWKERQTRQIGRTGERKKDDCRYNRGQLKVVSHELLGVAVLRDHLSIEKCTVSFLSPFRHDSYHQEEEDFYRKSHEALRVDS